MRHTPLIAFAALVTLAGPARAQDSFGGYPAAPSQPASTAQPAAPAKPAPATVPRRATPPSAAAPAVDPNDPEREDLGVPATTELHAGAMHGATPNTIPGGQVITTRGVVALVGNRDLHPLLFDVLGSYEALPGALAVVPAHQPGSFTDQTQQEFGQYLGKVTQGNKETPMVFYCQSKYCWMSYNASLRAINMGYRNVLWYRGGLEAWKAAGQKVQQVAQVKQ